ncbi:hypothetical protein DL765_000048 [Monosporascus sp. GIB2]|nr:hypothetical protein DL765_000048 [Monosporascus sp. GIB2]
MRRALFRRLVILGTLAGLGLSQDCPVFGPAYPEVTNPGPSAVFSAAKTAIDDEITKALASGQLANETYLAVQVFSRHSDKTLYERYYGSSIGPEALYRIASVSKVHIPELARLKVQNPVYDVDWSEVTLGALASHMGGIPRDYPVRQRQAQSVHKKGITRGFPISPSYYTPAYSNMAFQLLGYAVEKITGKAFPALVEEKMLNSLKLSRTFLTHPKNDSNALVVEGWDWDFGDEAPGGGYFSTATDLTTLGCSILSSTILRPATTRAWLKPLTHTGRPAFSLGRPWEIFRLSIPVSPLSPTTRVVDLYTKQGAIGQYQSMLALSPDHGVGYAMLVGGPQGAASYGFLQGRLNEVWVEAAEQAGTEEVAGVYGGHFTLEGDNEAAEFVMRDGEAAWFLRRLVSNGTDVVALVGGLAACWRRRSWADGKAVEVEVPVLKKTLRRDGKSCKRAE